MKIAIKVMGEIMGKIVILAIIIVLIGFARTYNPCSFIITD